VQGYQDSHYCIVSIYFFPEFLKPPMFWLALPLVQDILNSVISFDFKSKMSPPCCAPQPFTSVITCSWH
jgi:hypothetical protein